MFTQEERFKFILDRLELKGRVTVNELASILNVSKETIRKDLTTLENDQKLLRTHGGAKKYQKTNQELVFNKKINKCKKEKKLIAKRASKFISNNQIIFVDVGTTTYYLSEYLHDISNLTVVTSSISSCMQFNKAIEEERISGQVVMLAGITNPEQHSVKGAMTIEAIQKFKFDISFISCGSFNRYEVLDFDLDETVCSRQAMTRSNRNILLTDESKINKECYYKISDLNEFDDVITNMNRIIETNHQLNWYCVRR